jgi:hypothetical protein
MTPSLLVQVLIAGNADTFAMWILMLGPVAVFWLIFGIIFVAVRSVRNANWANCPLSLVYVAPGSAPKAWIISGGRIHTEVPRHVGKYYADQTRAAAGQESR